jgi:hypothetical protein
MNKEELISEYERVNKIHSELTGKILDMLSKTYEDKLRTCESVEELEKIYFEIQTEWPNTVGTFLMYKIYKKRKEELNNKNEDE